MINIPEIEKTARAATGGHWLQGQTHYQHQVITEGYGLFPDDPGFAQYVVLEGNQNYWEDAKKNVAHAASANPAAVLEMTQLVRELAGALDLVVAISDRKHDAWDAAKAALEKARQAGVTDHIVKANDMVITEQSSAVAVPDGWQLVPVAPTPEMVGAAFDLFELPSIHGYETGNEARRAIYGAMIAAAPKQEGK